MPEADIFYELLKLLDVKHTKLFSRKLYSEHAHKDNLFGLSKMLCEYGVDNEGLRFKDKDGLTELDVPFVAQLNEELVLVLKITGDNVTCFHRGMEKELPLTEFKEKWSGVVLAVYPHTQAIEPEYRENKRKESYKTALKYTLTGCICITMVSVVLTKHYFQNTGMLLALIINLLGVYIGYLLMLKQIKAHSASADKICSVLKHADCNNVLESKAAKL